jgi:hypothetical protein
MPPKAQRTLSFAPPPTPLPATPSGTRATPRRQASTITNYARPERIDEPFTNPEIPKTPRAFTRHIEDEDVEMDNASNDGMEDEEASSQDEDGEVIEVPDPETPSRRSLPTTVIIKKRRLVKKQRKARTKTSWTRHYFDLTPLEDTWINKQKKGHPKEKNHLWTCKWCGPAFQSTEKARHGNTTLLGNHLRLEHGLTEEKHELGLPPIHKSKTSQKGAMKTFLVPVEAIPSAEEAVLQFIAMSNQPFTIVESKAFKNLYRSVGTIAPIESAGTARNRIEDRFNSSRREMKAEFDETCETFSFSFDGWSASNHIHILAVIAHWLTATFERRSMVIEFAEMKGPKSGETMADILWNTLGPDYKKETEVIIDSTITTTTEERVGLDIAHKLFAVCGDNAGNNNTFCDHFHQRLLSKFENEPAPDSDSVRCRFRGRESRIRCIAHIISLIVDAIFAKLKAGDYAQAAALIEKTGNKAFTQGDCSSLSIYMKIRTFVLWIMKSDDRRAQWRKFCTVLIPLDVETRWNALYLMMFKARANKGAIIRFARAYPEVQHLVPTEEEWKTCEIMERCLEPFYDWTRSVSKAKPCLPETIGIMWGLDDLLDDINKKEGQFGDVGDDIREAFKAGVEVVDEYQKLINENIMYYAAAVLDPRIKFNLIDEQCDDPEKIRKDVKGYLKKEWLKAVPIENITQEEVELPEGASLHQLHLLRRARNTATSSVCDIDRYLDSPALHWDPSEKSNYEPDWVLHWWAANAFQYPLMAEAARALLAIPGAEVDVERLFSGGRDLLGIRRFALNGESMRILTILKAYFERMHAKDEAQYKAQLPEVRLHYSLIRKFKADYNIYSYHWNSRRSGRAGSRRIRGIYGGISFMNFMKFIGLY